MISLPVFVAEGVKSTAGKALAKGAASTANKIVSKGITSTVGEVAAEDFAPTTAKGIVSTRALRSRRARPWQRAPCQL